MSSACFVLFATFSLLVCGGPVNNASAADEKINVDDTVRKGLDWLAKTQMKDGSFHSNGMYSVSLTSLAGITFLMEGSTPQEGRYTNTIKKAIEFVEQNAQESGLLCSLRVAAENSRYLIAHGYAVLFLASAWHEETDEKRRAQLQKTIEKALLFTAKAQNSKGGWGYVSARDGGDFDEGCSSLIQLQSLAAAKKMGLKVPHDAIEKAIKYFKEATTADGGIRYSSSQNKQAGSSRPAFTAGVIACYFTNGDFRAAELKPWLGYCQKNIPLSRVHINTANNEFMFHYYSQVAYVLGDDGHRKLIADVDDKNALRWSQFRSEVFKALQARQLADGSWAGSTVGPVYQTIVNLSVLQLEKGILPIYQR